ncbi:MAG: class II aldolase/adducin family protein [Gammaproteobacteria bacterium]|nr:class II aldolase/adducin family protein [Gammaproteobacteria bacterium]MCW8840393.1 class II aldolase/adducin family protein [Gammaproteobacteria bacterium]MCW8928120.1 class II aldolase/adducin family protein [Gammaproteobacteria bacterium]MCW8957614.1 class II aldolase/adducin family protein [Gammaproteobacteria bacterium]MCW8972985.1 class II aldolase/adducin family protein [Gammaproteobacteria bacterium]
MDPREDLVRHYRWLRQYGNNDSHSGNASVRVARDFWVTPSGACADTLSADQLIRCELEGRLGDDASLDAPLHRLVYRHNPEAGAVLHSHGPYTVAMTLSGQDFIPPDFEGQYYFPRVPVITISYDRYVDEAPERVAEVLAEYPITVVRGHGVYAQAKNLNLAYKWSCSLELSAKTAFLALQAGTLTD